MKSLFLLALGSSESADKTADGVLSIDQSQELRYMDENGAKLLIRKIFNVIDADQSSELDRSECVAWIRRVEHDHVDKDATIVFDDYDKDGDGYLNKKEFVQVAEITVAEVGNEVDFAREMRNFKQCDINGDEQLSLDEFKGFLYPQYYDHTYSIHIDNNVNIFDTDKDGVISKEEYIAEIKRVDPDMDINLEMEAFLTFDKNVNGQLDHDEIHEWLIPSQYDPAEAEFDHLLSHADQNNNGLLDVNELVANYAILMEIQTTRWGRITHDEL